MYYRFNAHTSMMVWCNFERVLKLVAQPNFTGKVLRLDNLLDL